MYDERMLLHDDFNTKREYASPEIPLRISSIYDYLKANKYLDKAIREDIGPITLTD